MTSKYNDPLLTPAEAAAHLVRMYARPCTAKTILSAIRSGKLKAARRNPTVLYQSDVEEYVPRAVQQDEKKAPPGTSLEFTLEAEYQLSRLPKKRAMEKRLDPTCTNPLDYFEYRALKAGEIERLPRFRDGDIFWSKTFEKFFRRRVTNGRVEFGVVSESCVPAVLRRRGR